MIASKKAVEGSNGEGKRIRLFWDRRPDRFASGKIFGPQRTHLNDKARASDRGTMGFEHANWVLCQGRHL